ncbi:MAG TPA: PAS domain-containing protein [Candidatus Levybacteria bacterium]|nr:PAS domain-containing protein [Candidatus Levybacteria bacterium]
MDEHQHHEELIQFLINEYQEVLANSEQDVYIYLDDQHKVCNEKFSSLLGYESADEWATIDTSFPETFVADKSQEILITAYQDAMEKKIGSTNNITWKKKDGSTVDTQVILVPIAHDGHLFALHFVSNR